MRWIPWHWDNGTFLEDLLNSPGSIQTQQSYRRTEFYFDTQSQHPLLPENPAPRLYSDLATRLANQAFGS